MPAGRQMEYIFRGDASAPEKSLHVGMSPEEQAELHCLLLKA